MYITHLFKLDIVWSAIFSVISWKISMTLHSAVLLLIERERGGIDERERVKGERKERMLARVNIYS